MDTSNNPSDINNSYHQYIICEDGFEKSRPESSVRIELTDDFSLICLEKMKQKEAEDLSHGQCDCPC